MGHWRHRRDGNHLVIHLFGYESRNLSPFHPPPLRFCMQLLFPENRCIFNPDNQPSAISCTTSLAELTCHWLAGCLDESTASGLVHARLKLEDLCSADAVKICSCPRGCKRSCKLWRNAWDASPIASEEDDSHVSASQ